MAPLHLASLHLGQPREYLDAQGKPWCTALIKEAVSGPVMVRSLGLDGDAVANTVHHGGIHQAVMVYARSHRAYWQERFGLDIGPGGLGENFSVEGLDDETVCIGDVYRIGTALLQVSQPRQPCATLSRYWQRPELLTAIWETGRSGWYFRVLQEGDVNPGPMALEDRPHPGWSSARVLRAFRDAASARDEASAAADLAHLTPAWQAKLREKASH